MKRQKITQRVEPKDQTRLAAIEMVFTPEECLQLIAAFTPRLEPALVETMDLAQSASIRRSSAVFVVPNQSTNWVFERLRKAVREINDEVYGFDVSQFREGFQFTRYEVGEYYGPHFDIGPGKLAERKLSLTVQLSAPDEYTGGELIIYPDFEAPRDQGTMTVFPSFMCHNVCSGEDRCSLLAGELAGRAAVQMRAVGFSERVPVAERSRLGLARAGVST